VDIAPPNLAAVKPQSDTEALDCAPPVEEEFASGVAQPLAGRFLTDALAGELWQRAGGASVELSAAEFADALEAIGTESNFGLGPGVETGAREREAFWRSLHLEELAIARGCALGRDAAWQRFLAQYREPLTRAAVAMTGETAAGEELANTLYSELFGLTEREGKRWSPLLRYSGRGSLMGWLRAVLAQRRVNQYRKTSRESPLDEIDPAAPAPEPRALEPLKPLQLALEKVLATVSAEERFLLSAYYLDMHKLHELSRVLRVHEATVSRKLKRATGRVRKELLRALVAQGLSRRAAEEALGTDPRDVDVNLRKLLQNPGAGAISSKEGRE
jgi:RNA polymerase sigma-70 factor, ECF subfamily